MLSQIQEMRKGIMVENRIISIADQVGMEVFRRCSEKSYSLRHTNISLYPNESYLCTFTLLCSYLKR